MHPRRCSPIVFRFVDVMPFYQSVAGRRKPWYKSFLYTMYVRFCACCRFLLVGMTQLTTVGEDFFMNVWELPQCGQGGPSGQASR